MLTMDHLISITGQLSSWSQPSVSADHMPAYQLISCHVKTPLQARNYMIPWSMRRNQRILRHYGKKAKMSSSESVAKCYRGDSDQWPGVRRKPQPPAGGNILCRRQFVISVYDLFILVPWRNVHARNVLVTFWHPRNVHPTQRPRVHYVHCDNWSQGGRIVCPPLKILFWTLFYGEMSNQNQCEIWFLRARKMLTFTKHVLPTISQHAKGFIFCFKKPKSKCFLKQ